MLQGPDEIYSWTSKFLSEFVYDLDEEAFLVALEKMDMLALQGNKSAILFLHEFYLIGPIKKATKCP
ncbi:hypothetical protein VIBNISOn1_30138 [Vibrio nigripulchritudo SOn1]|uniref:Uncharacterized protein n=1 Tax=Vibrio nigripulchritudo SOn1 TaxID=1238450 RepID=A0AAV2VSS2_9VIBR|nr:hypothetical protein [Vibrio nigripulchritudo]CCO47444.1 hypothetical protein VIBNISOn1_30138 [Vibrio nigripulchritudo SOn1]